MRQPAERGKKAFPTFYLAAYYYLKFSKNPKPKSEEHKQSDWKFQWNWTEFSNEETEVTEKYLQSCSTSLAIGMQIKTALRLHPTLVIIAKTKKTTAKADKEIIIQEFLFSHCFNITREVNPVIENEVKTAWKISNTAFEI